MLRTGLIGAAVTGVCCFTPLLPALGVAGASLAFIDGIALTLFGFFLAIALLGWMRGRRA